jgi:8-amino-7-oxononanoate synthase
MTFDFIAQQLAEQKKQFRYRQRICITDNQGQYIKVDGKNYINFSSNDYLGLSQHPAIAKAMQQGVDQYGACSSGSSLVTGYQYPHRVLEEQICQWLNKERCLLFSSGFTANMGVLQSLAKPDSYFWLDKLSHASLIDGALTSEANTRRFLHNDLSQLENFISKHAEKNNLIVTEGVFSMDGDRAPISELITLINNQIHKPWLFVDDAHSIGVVGKQGQGSASFDQHNSINITMATFGKAIATSGAFVACDNELAEYLTNFCRHYIYSTAISPAVAAATTASIELIKQEHWRREKIQKLSDLFISQLNCKVNVLPTQSSIHALVIGDEKKTLTLSEQLKKEGFWLTAIRPPTVANNSSRLRVTICSNHNANDINKLSQCINKVLN